MHNIIGTKKIQVIRSLSGQKSIIQNNIYFSELVASRKVSCLIKVPKDTPTCLTIPVEVEEYEKYNFMRRHHNGDFDVEFELTAEMTVEVQHGIEFKLHVTQAGPVEIPASRISNQSDFFLRPGYYFLG